MRIQPDSCSCPPDISEADIIEAMRQIPGFIDITPTDFRAIYKVAFEFASERLLKSVRARDIMTRNVVSVLMDTPLVEVASLLGRYKFSGLPVVDSEKRVKGIISEKDFLSLMGVERGDTFMSVVAQCLIGKGCPGIPIRKQTAADLMISPAIDIGENATVSEIATLMTEKGINRLPVTDSNGRLQGIVTRSAVVLSFCSTET